MLEAKLAEVVSINTQLAKMLGERDLFDISLMPRGQQTADQLSTARAQMIQVSDQIGGFLKRRWQQVEQVDQLATTSEGQDSAEKSEGRTPLKKGRRRRRSLSRSFRLCRRRAIQWHATWHAKWHARSRLA